jgi:hypothetical protein
MNRKSVTWLLLIVLPILLILVVMVTIPSVRFATFRVATEFPAIATHFVIQKHVEARNFSSSAAGLDRQLWIAKNMGVAKSAMLRGLLKNTEMVMGHVEIASDYLAMEPYLERLAVYLPDIFSVRLWLADALSFKNPKSAFAELEEAARLVPADDRTYHIAVRTALSIGDKDAARDWCNRYQSAHFGGTSSLLYRNIFSGTSLRKIAIEVRDKAGNLITVPNEGVVLNKVQTYDFDLPKRISLETFRLHLGLMPGIKVSMQSISIYGPNGRKELLPEDIIMIPRDGFVLDRRTIVTTSPFGDVITFRGTEKFAGPADRVDLHLSFSRVGLSTLPGCIGN